MEVIDTIDNFRNKVSNIFDRLRPYLLCQDKYYELFFKILDEVKGNESFYENMIKVAFLDSYRMYYHYVLEGESEYIDELEYYEENIHDFNDLLVYIDDCNLVDMIQETIYFNSLSRNEQRTILNDCKKKDSYLNSVVPFHIIDKMFYAYPVSLTSFINNDDKLLAILEYSKTIEDLAISDVDSCTNIIRDLVINYKNYLENSTNLTLEELKIKDIIYKDFITVANIVIQNNEIRNELLNKYYVLKRTSKKK